MKTELESMRRNLLQFLELPASPFKMDVLDKFRNAVNFLVNSSLDLCDDKDISITQNDLDLIEWSFTLLEHLFFEIEISADLARFISDYVLLVQSWDESGINTGAYKERTRKLTGLYTLHMTTLDLIMVAKRLMLRIDVIGKSYALPSTELTKQYLDTLFKEKS